MDNADDDDDEGGGADDAKDAVDLRARLIEAGGASSSAEASPEKDRGISGIPIEDNGVTYSMSGPKPGTSWASTCVSMLRDPETFCVVAVSAAMGTAEYSIAGAVMMLLSGVMSFGGPTRRARVPARGARVDDVRVWTGVGGGWDRGARGARRGRRG